MWPLGVERLHGKPQAQWQQGLVTAVLASGTHRLLTLAGGWRLCAGGVFVEEWEELRNSSAGALDGCLWLKYYSLKSRSPELGLRPGSASVRGKRAGGCSPLMLSSGNPGGMGWGPVPYQQMPSLSPPTPHPPRAHGRSELCPGKSKLSCAWKTLHQAGISWSFLNPWAMF